MIKASGAYAGSFFIWRGRIEVSWTVSFLKYAASRAIPSWYRPHP